MCVLLVEDDPIILMDVGDSLEQAGHLVVMASNAEEAIGLIDRNPGHFTILVTDHDMPPPKLTGADLIAHMRTTYPAIPMILASAKPDPITAEFRNHHRVHMLPKPYGNAALIAKVNGLLNLK